MTTTLPTTRRSQHGSSAPPRSPSKQAGNVVAAPDAHVSLLEVDELIVAAFENRLLIAPRSEYAMWLIACAIGTLSNTSDNTSHAGYAQVVSPTVVCQ
ncbi:hypothetical protein [Natrinema limicola]|uniref:Uncharacterized protein n=1 Tax=Natrinema limicola JCM 13563 TaxID=1230457 RepID=M0CRZ5_9EURY|nr:hypothetical protein [Natrinema limicola]ELZ26015.1 hypothetical protein C476_01152 [Natrinema limicola JCM 13563]